MPQVMTPEEASNKLCPFMSGSFQHASGDVTFSRASCSGNDCSCWGWADPERGQESQAAKSHERTKLPEGETPAGDGWHKSHFETGPKIQSWWRRKVIGPRRGQCEAMSPYIEVNQS